MPSGHEADPVGQAPARAPGARSLRGSGPGTPRRGGGSELSTHRIGRSGAGSSLLLHAAKVLEGARRVGVPVIHCTAESLPQGLGRNTNARLFVAAHKLGMDNRPGSDSVRPVSDLGPFDTDIVLPRFHGLSPLTGSSLDSVLRNSGVRTLVVMGVSLNVAIPNLVFDAVNRSYQVVLVSDAVAGVPPEYGAQMIEHTLSLVCTIASSEEIVDAWA